MANYSKFTNANGDELVVIPDTSTATDGDVLSYKDAEIKWAPAGGGSGGAKIVSKNPSSYSKTTEVDGSYLYCHLKPNGTVDNFMDGIIKSNGSIFIINFNFSGTGNINVNNLRVFIRIYYKDSNELSRSTNDQPYSISCFGVDGQSSRYVNTLTYIIPKLPQEVIDGFEEIRIEMSSNSTDWNPSADLYIEKINIFSFE